MVITTALYIILGILAFFVFLFAVRVRVTIDMAGDDMSLVVMVCGVKIKILPKKPKKYKISNYTLKKIAKRDKKKALKEEKKAKAKAEKKAKKAAEKKRKKEEAAKLTKAEKKAIKAKKKASMPPLPALLSLLLKTLGVFFPGIFSKFHFHIARIRLSIGGADAAQIALMYYAVSRAFNPILSFIEKNANLHGRKNADIDISPDFLSEDIKIDVKVGFSTSLGGILGALLKTAFSFLFGFLKIKPSAPADGGHKISENTEKTSKDNPKGDPALKPERKKDGTKVSA